MKNRKVVLVTKSSYSPEADDLLLELLENGAKLICIVGVDCSTWEDALDELAVGDGSQVYGVTTTSHPAESESDVIEFADLFALSENSRVKVVRI
ncbi:hypothetical protein [Vibrio nigripulchritudo]|uniref:hypothetical protein n=1 Tax=Vibrio nigripulchritudo TaxID=28173 RepID=UPI00249309BC|nr:hypothetical protein [Vibrio nigripulchritudo]BDU37352.1 hypothetical protein TUMSATVNIG2_18210 [Vibrio nigripulchritudo]BDU43074.1 hypothetical protein TUMSATVNIG3_18720 [Vibrio nigripulchritudo]